MNNELTEVMKRAKAEIESLRRRNEILAARVETMDAFMCVLQAKPVERMNQMQVDIAWELQMHIEEIERNQPNTAN